MPLSSDLPAGTGRVHSRWAAVGRVQVDFFFQNRTLLVSYPCPSRVHGYHGYEYGGTRAHGSAGREQDGSAGQTL
jgi:hypothetical protein